MIVKIQGTVIEKSDGTIVIDTTSGIGYKVHVTHATIEQINTNTLCLHIYHHIREDNQQLFGFPTIEERNGFITLISVSGMGPKAAMKVLSACLWHQLHHLIRTSDINQLTRLPGIGKKLAERLITELRDKLSKDTSLTSVSARHASTSNQNDLLLALRSLGYQTNEIKQALDKAGAKINEQPLEQSIKVALKHLT